MTDDIIEPVAKPAQPTPFAAPLRLVAVGVLRILSIGLAGLADRMEEDGKV